ncbi:MAG: QsdR family transcriptional regulator [Aeromicrobium sp.]|uniref:QsdR family transcriptional regulator n=1 Tax=Aeromicrobium sp. TaxID=1871063 RepID=UPI002610234C|nr:QsdR family transcriptional regulator [Aeromicrobium sp.]MDF1703900.1 QsdR family transcriptional regulator [Aeromicrobium sp.]
MGHADLPQLVRPSKQLAMEYARRLFIEGSRIDMQALASALGVGRTTIYRWLGDREAVIADLLAELGATSWQLAGETGSGSGIDRVLAVTRRYMEITSSFEPLTTFARREPEVALRVLMSADGPTARMIHAGLRESLDRDAPESSTLISDETVDVLVQLGTALQWAPIVIGAEPAIDRAISLARTVIDQALAADASEARRPATS